MKEIERNKEYRIIEEKFKGITQTFRHWINGTIEIKFNDEFARANGYKSVEHMLRCEPEMRKQIERCGGVPEWLICTDEGNFLVVNKSCLN